MLDLIRSLNLLSYNKREIVQKTWRGEKNDSESDDEKFMEMLCSDPESQKIIALENQNNLIEYKNQENLIDDNSDTDSVKKTLFF
jgi:hypothetical protein